MLDKLRVGFKNHLVQATKVISQYVKKHFMLWLKWALIVDVQSFIVQAPRDSCLHCELQDTLGTPKNL